MRTWLALLVAPILALADQSVAYATVGWACANQQAIAVHAVHIVFLVAVVAATFAAWQRMRETAAMKSGGEATPRRHFLAGLATASGALSALAIVAMWIPAWVLGACLA
jgi:hypothetical protein